VVTPQGCQDEQCGGAEQEGDGEVGGAVATDEGGQLGVWCVGQDALGARGAIVDRIARPSAPPR
jgi:hypothetical protein